MIKFFRKIRQKLIEQSKVRSYFLYAFGEIVLVVIGILIALQINNWNEIRKDKQKETIYLSNLERDLENQILSINNQIEFENVYIEKSGSIIAQFISNSFSELEISFYQNLSNLHSRKTFVITDPTYTDLISSGNINLIKNQKFKDHLIKYYQELKRIEKVIQNNNSLLVDQQFGVKFLQLGYYYNNLALDSMKYIPKTPTFQLTTIYHKELSEISKDLLQKPENKLELMNIVNMRHSISLGHLGLMIESKKSTEKILEEIKRNTND
ncbi:MAG: DUF6090 family protein [Polaribacter sp.]|nr:DUF6090 family protein [Polaribacter sp.]